LLVGLVRTGASWAICRFSVGVYGPFDIPLDASGELPDAGDFGLVVCRWVDVERCDIADLDALVVIFGVIGADSAVVPAIPGKVRTPPTHPNPGFPFFV